MEERGEDFEYLSKFDWFATNDMNKCAGLTTKDDSDFLQSIVTLQEKNNRGMSRPEVVGTIMAITLTHKRKAELHFDCLQRSKQLPKLKGYGTTQTVQKTTTKRTQVRQRKTFAGMGP